VAATFAAMLTVLGWNLCDCAWTDPPACRDAGSEASVVAQEPAARRATSTHGTTRSEPDRRVEITVDPDIVRQGIVLPAGISLQGATHCGGFLAHEVPQLSGTVSRVNGPMVTIRITDNPGGVEVKPGYSFAVYAGTTYKVEARVSRESHGIAYCSMTHTKPGTSIEQGDCAATRTN